MAISVKDKDKTNGVVIEIDNGHLEALNNIQAKYKIVDKKAAIEFMLAVIERTEGRGVSVDGKMIGPSQEIVKK